MTNRPRFFARPFRRCRRRRRYFSLGAIGRRADEGVDLEPVKAWIEKASQIDTAVIELCEMRNVKRPLLSTGATSSGMSRRARSAGSPATRRRLGPARGVDSAVARLQRGPAELQDRRPARSLRRAYLAFIEAGS
ncbi:MAG: hypothetical protein R3F11_15760 [Verrucomicrobiales bacterium]